MSIKSIIKTILKSHPGVDKNQIKASVLDYFKQHEFPSEYELEQVSEALDERLRYYKSS
jgi:hypothetical protein